MKRPSLRYLLLLLSVFHPETLPKQARAYELLGWTILVQTKPLRASFVRLFLIGGAMYDLLPGEFLFRETCYQIGQTHQRVSCHRLRPYSSPLQLQRRSQQRSWEELSQQSEESPDICLGCCHARAQREDLLGQHRRRMLCPLQ